MATAIMHASLTRGVLFHSAAMMRLLYDFTVLSSFQIFSSVERTLSINEVRSGKNGRRYQSVSAGREGSEARNRVMMGCYEVRVSVDVRVECLMTTHQLVTDGISRRLEG